MRILAEDSVLVNIDFQERLLPHMYNSGELVEKTIKLIQGVKALGLPILTTQQYSRGLGNTDSRISAALGYGDPEELPWIEKAAFSSYNFV